MTPERLIELRRSVDYHVEFNRQAELSECLDEIERSQRALKLISVDYDQRCHDMKQLRQHMDCDGSDLAQLCAAWDANCREVKRLQELIRDREANLSITLSRIAHDGVRNGRMRHDIGILLMTAVREAAAAGGDDG